MTVFKRVAQLPGSFADKGSVWHVRCQLCQASVISSASACRPPLEPVQGVEVAGEMHNRRHSVTALTLLRPSSSRFAHRLRRTWVGRKVCFISLYKVSSKHVFTAMHVERVTLEMRAEMLVGLRVVSVFRCPILINSRVCQQFVAERCQSQLS